MTNASTRLLLCLILSAIPHPKAQGRYPATAFLRQPDTARTVVAYELTPQEECCFAADTTRLSCFWQAWDSVPAARSVSILGGADAHCAAWGRMSTGPNDCTVSLKLAYGDQGVYLCIEARDNVWCDGCLSVNYDQSFVYFDPHPSGVLYDSLLFVDKISQLTRSFLAIHASFTTDRSAVITTYDASDSLQHSSFNHLAFSGLFPSYGILVNAPVYDTSRMRRQEWRIPWSRYGSGTTRRHPGDRLAMTFGYQDSDMGEDNAFLKWRNCADPYDAVVDSAHGDSTAGHLASIDCWGDILFGPRLDSLVTAAGASLSGCACACTNRAVATRLTSSIRGIAPPQYFTLTGRSISIFSPSKDAVDRVIVERRTNPSGASASRLVTAVRR